MNFHIFDIIFICFLLIMGVFGYLKGFITRLYDFVGTLVVLFVSYFFCKPLSLIWVVYQYDQTDAFSKIIGQIMNQLLIFVILFVVLTIVKKILGFMIKPLLNKIMDTFKLTSFTNKVLGVVLSMGEGLLISYLCLIFVVIPFYNNGMQEIQSTTLTKHVIEIVPGVASQINETITGFKNYQQTSFNDTNVITKLLLTANDLHLIDDNQFMTIFDEQIKKQIEKQNITLSVIQLQELEDILKDSGYNDNQIKGLISKINVSDE